MQRHSIFLGIKRTNEWSTETLYSHSNESNVCFLYHRRREGGNQVSQINLVCVTLEDFDNLYIYTYIYKTRTKFNFFEKW